MMPEKKWLPVLRGLLLWGGVPKAMDVGLFGMESPNTGLEVSRTAQDSSSVTS